MSRLGRFRISKRTRRSVTGFFTFFIILFLVLQGAGLRPIFAIQQGFSRVGTFFGKSFTYVRTYDEFQQELSVLREQVHRLAIETSEVEQLEQENRELRALLSFMDEEHTSYTVISAQILTRSFGDQRAQFVIDKGSRDGLESGHAVIVEDGIIIGVLEDVRDHLSTVRLLTDHRSRIASRLSSSETIGVSEGAKGSLLNFGFIPQHVVIEPNDLVFTSGLEETIPGNLVIGFVTAVTEDDTQPFKTATIEPIVDVRLYQTVGVIRPDIAL